jgi:dihydrolipoamide dehydrogenase
MKRHVKVAIIGAGSAGLSALRQVKKTTGDYVLIDRTPLGTTCARVGCMPSKALIQVAGEFQRRRLFAESGITGSAHLACDIPAVLRHVRSLRNRFTEGMVQATQTQAGDRLLVGQAKFLDVHHLQVGDLLIEADHVVIAVGAKPDVPKAWRCFADRILTYESLFEQETLPPRMAVIGLGPVGLELGQALSRLGIEMTGFSSSKSLGGLSDPEVNAVIRKSIAEEFPIHLEAPAEVEAEGNTLVVRSGKTAVTVDRLLVAVGSSPALEGLGLERLGVVLNQQGLPAYDARTCQVGDLPVYMAGDVTGCRPVLHEALDEGHIAGLNVLADVAESYCRRPALRIVFCAPQLAVVGQSFAQLQNTETVIGSVFFEDESRAVIEGTNRGLLRIYVDPASGLLLGAEAACPGAEHLGHVLALAMQQRMTVSDLLQMPFYHPTAEEALRAALLDAAQKLPVGGGSPVPALCGSCPEPPLC